VTPCAIKSGMVRLAARDRASAGWRLRLIPAVAGVAGIGVAAWTVARLHGTPVSPVAHFLFTLAVIVFVAHLAGMAFARYGQPAVAGEMLGGVMLGPSVLGWIWPGGQAWLFAPDVSGSLDLGAELGLVVFMFLLGSELSLDKVRAQGRLAGWITAGMTVPPMAGGMVLAMFGRPLMGGAAGHPAAYILYLGLAMSITALPVLARILIDARLKDSPLGSVVLACAAAGDAFAWAMLALILALGGFGDTRGLATMAGLGLPLILVTVMFVRPALKAFVRSPSGREALTIPVLLGGAIGYAAIAQLIGFDAVIGAFAFGTVIPRDSPVAEQAIRPLNGFVVAILLPVFFAEVGLDTNARLLGAGGQRWMFLLAALFVASVTKLAGASGAARLRGVPAADAIRIGVLVNCRGVTELAIASIGLRYHVISELGFTILVLVALGTTAMTGPLLGSLDRRAPGGELAGRWS
jgi:Kef-type K+ transport system membrane component KefB